MIRMELMFKDSHNALEKLLFFFLAMAGIAVICIYNSNEHLATLIVTNVITASVTALATISRGDKNESAQSNTIKDSTVNQTVKTEDKSNG